MVSPSNHDMTVSPLYTPLTMMMDEFGGMESGAPSEGEGGASEALSEEKRQAFAGATQAIQQIRKEEKKAKKRDDGVAQLILQFLTDEQRSHLATLISRLVAINCPSHFILAILSLISEPCAAAVNEYLKDILQTDKTELANPAMFPEGQLDAEATKKVAEWVARIDAVLTLDAPQILKAIIVQEQNIDGTVLQLTTFVLQDFFQAMGREIPFDRLQPVSIGILQSSIGPHMQAHMARTLAAAPKKAEED